MTFTCVICGKEGKGTLVSLGDKGLAYDPPAGWPSRTTAMHGRQVTCSWEHAHELMSRDFAPKAPKS